MYVRQGDYLLWSSVGPRRTAIGAATECGVARGSRLPARGGDAVVEGGKCLRFQQLWPDDSVELFQILASSNISVKCSLVRIIKPDRFQFDRFVPVGYYYYGYGFILRRTIYIIDTDNFLTHNHSPE